MNSGAKQLSIGMLGCGVVGSQVARLLQDDEQELSERSGAVLRLLKVGVRTAGPREGVNPALITTDLQSIVSDPSYRSHGWNRACKVFDIRGDQER